MTNDLPGDSTVTSRLGDTVDYVLDVLTQSLHRGEDTVLDVYSQDFRPESDERRAYDEAIQFR